MNLFRRIRDIISAIHDYRTKSSINFDPPSPMPPYQPKLPVRPGDAAYKEDK